MGLAQSIVIVNQFSVKGPDGSGSRGSTPGLYVERYVVDGDKNEALWPLDSDTPETAALRYEDLHERVMASDDIPTVKKVTESSRDGVAFSGDAMSLSFDELRVRARRIQEAFDAGKTVFKTVLTFDDDYLLKLGVMEPHVGASRLGSHKGHVDQLRLRSAVQKGMERLGDGFDDLYWVAGAHLDRKHVHFHVAAVDLGVGRVRYDGQQRGTLGVVDKRRLRSGIDDSLQDSKSLRPFFRTPSVERTRVANTVRGYIHDRIAKVGTPQLILASLPEDESLWDAGSEHPLMRRANELAHDYVREVLSESGSGFDSAIVDIWAYAEAVGQERGLDEDERASIALRGRRALERACVNSVYECLARARNVETAFSSPFMDVMMRDMDELSHLSGSDRLAEFGYRMRSYSTRLDFHKRERRRFHEAEQTYLATPDASPGSRAAYEFYAFEALYQERLMAKYQHFMGFLPSDGEWRDRVRDVLSLRVAQSRMAGLVSDSSVRHLSADDAEVYGVERYRCRGGGRLVADPHALDDALDAATVQFDEAEDALAFDVAEDGMVPHWDRSGSRLSLSLRHELLHSFDDVKALDLHHLGHDFPSGVDVSAQNVVSFVECAETRKAMLDEALDYFRNTGQGSVEKVLPVGDVESMWELAQALAAGASVTGTAHVGDGGGRHVKTVEISKNLEEATRGRILGTIATNTGLEQVKYELEL